MLRLKNIWRLVVWLGLLSLSLGPARAGVTIITHGLNGNADGWVTGMATNIPNYSKFFGTNYSCYEMYFYPSNASYYLTATRVAGTAATSPASGEVVIKLDWGPLADGNSYNTFQVAGAVTLALLNTNFISELGGHAVVEFPMHFIGHSRGGSLLCEVSRQLGTNGVWVDHLTTLDPHPLNDPEFPLDDLIYDAVDAPANTYLNVLFHDNYWQDISSLFRGKTVAGSYTRKLASLDGGYGGSAGPHSDVHLWYHGTVDMRTPTSDTEAGITATQRSSWWTGMETNGGAAGFLYSLIGGGNRASTNRPMGAGLSAVRDGLNQAWDFGAGVAANRTALPSNNGNWPNLIKVNRASTNAIEPGASTALTYAYQWARPATSNAVVRVYLDADLNPLNTNQTLLQQWVVPANGAGFVSFGATNILVAGTNVVAGRYWFLTSITGGGRTRWLYAPEAVDIAPSRQAPDLDIARLGGGQYQIGVNGVAGQTIVIQSSTNFGTWVALATNTLTGNRWNFVHAPAGNVSARFYRAVVE